MAATNKNKAAAAAKEKAANGTASTQTARPRRKTPTNQKELATEMKRQGAEHARKPHKAKKPKTAHSIQPENFAGFAELPAFEKTAMKALHDFREISDRDQGKALAILIRELRIDRLRRIEDHMKSAELTRKSVDELDFAIAQA